MLQRFPNHRLYDLAITRAARDNAGRFTTAIQRSTKPWRYCVWWCLLLSTSHTTVYGTWPCWHKKLFVLRYIGPGVTTFSRVIFILLSRVSRQRWLEIVKLPRFEFLDNGDGQITHLGKAAMAKGRIIKHFFSILLPRELIDKNMFVFLICAWKTM